MCREAGEGLRPGKRCLKWGTLPCRVCAGLKQRWWCVLAGWLQGWVESAVSQQQEQLAQLDRQQQQLAQLSRQLEGELEQQQQAVRPLLAGLQEGLGQLEGRTESAAKSIAGEGGAGGAGGGGGAGQERRGVEEWVRARGQQSHSLLTLLSLSPLISLTLFSLHPQA